jgi:hypothetical protein
MADRREFLKSAGFLSLASLSKGVSAQAQKGDAEAAPGHASPEPLSQAADAVVLENAEMRLMISASGSALSLIHKPSGQECLVKGTGVPMFDLTQYRPYDNELQLAYPAKTTHFPANKIRREGDRLIVSFALVGYDATIEIKITDSYIAFQLEKLTFVGYTAIKPKRASPIDETVFLQLPVRNRKHLGKWLNVMWDDEVAVNILATDPRTQIEAKPRDGFHLFQAGTVRDVQLEGVGAALITTRPRQLLDRIARVEEDFNLPKGAESRRRKEYKYSYYQMFTMTPQEVERHIKYAKMAGLRTMMVYCLTFSKTAGHFPWRPEYPNGMADLRDSVAKISDAGIIPGLHILYNMTHERDAYVTPKPDPRLNLSESFILTDAIDAASTVISVEENPRLCTMVEGKRILKIQNELISYRQYTTNPPYRFEGCERGALGTDAAPHEMSSPVGLLDMYGGGNPDWLFVRFAQDTSIQAEVASRLQAIYKDAGFKFMYFDGSEQVPPPYWYNVSLAQMRVYEGLEPKPLLSEGSCKSHFSWHILTRGNAFDTFIPEQMKAGVRAYPAAEAPRAVEDFTSINFGWVGYWAPSEKTIGTQPDMLEFVTSRAAAWDCPISLSQGGGNILSALETHPRTPDNLEVIRRWEEIRAQDCLTQEQKMALRNLNQEHTLLIDERGKFVLTPWDQIENVAGGAAPGRAFLFERKGNIWVAYWHTSGEGFLELPIVAKQVTLMRELGKSTIVVSDGKQLKVPLGERRYLEFAKLNRQEVIRAFRNATIVPS